MDVVLGIDVSTTATKAVLVDEAGLVRGIGTAEYPLSHPRPLWSEQDSSWWWDGACTAIREGLGASSVSPDEVVAVGLTGQMHGLVLLDAAGDVLRPAILWNDQRTGRECEWIRATLGLDRLVAITGNDALAGFTAPKLVWIREHEPAVWDRVAHILLPKDYVRLRLTGDFATDKADGSGTILFDLRERDWSPEVAGALGIDTRWLPTTFEGPDVTGRVTATASAATGLPIGTPIVAGGGDQAASAVGAGAVVPGRATISLGTSGVIFATTSEPLYEPAGRVHAFCHAIPGRWHLMTVMLSAAGSLRWFRDVAAPGEGYDALTREAAQVGAGSDGLLFLPYLSGERSPYADPLARGAFVGLTLEHERRHLTRAVLEGVAFGLRDGLDLMCESGLEAPSQVRISGGGSVSSLWRQILADVLGAEIVAVNTSEGAAYGAAILAAVGAGWYSSVEDAVARFVTSSVVASPGRDRTTYADVHRRYRELYPALAPTFHRQAVAQEAPAALEGIR